MDKNCLILFDFLLGRNEGWRGDATRLELEGDKEGVLVQMQRFRLRTDKSDLSGLLLLFALPCLSSQISDALVLLTPFLTLFTAILYT